MLIVAALWKKSPPSSVIEGTVQAVNSQAGRVQLGTDSGLEIWAAFDSSSTPAVGDRLVVLRSDGAYQIVGRAQAAPAGSLSEV